MKGKVVDQFISFSQMYYPEDIGTYEHQKMQSGKLGIYEITKLTGIDDWGSKNITKDFIGYDGVKQIRECTLEEFIKLYEDYLK